ncbi:FkbO/Hyg5 family chorismatase [Streptomyces sp. NPDC005955]|uniref:FkbO/Hyg5 family chorismatase n=1 Tax=Streptomyces sp. NPDC005955 TaxID=3364738 RepID=UPI0036AE9CEA
MSGETLERNVLGVVRFNTEPASPVLDDGYPSVSVHATETTDGGFAELWTSELPTEAGRQGSVSYAHDGEYLFAACRIPEMADYTAASESTYTEALRLAEGLGYPHVFRIWHYISRLNDENASGLEVYREFCVGRARALERFAIGRDMPAATVIGSRSGGIVIYFLANRSGHRRNLDNPRQVRPFHYPSTYGPRSPNFARATYLTQGTGVERIFVSGTASILGHRTTNVGDVEGQCRLSLDNVAHLVGAQNLAAHGISPGSSLSDLRSVKVYVRHQSDIARVQQVCREMLSPSADVVYVNADVCRADLLVELEGIVVRSHAIEPDDATARNDRWNFGELPGPTASAPTTERVTASAEVDAQPSSDEGGPYQSRLDGGPAAELVDRAL